ncbi:ras1 guanine nucleotide exchange factor [Pelomyxa schiedti]|nr:ras1 guanine nucleotide exchange factor [Pelomyxa schiedti]
MAMTVHVVGRPTRFTVPLREGLPPNNAPPTSAVAATLTSSTSSPSLSLSSSSCLSTSACASSSDDPRSSSGGGGGGGSLFNSATDATRTSNAATTTTTTTGSSSSCWSGGGDKGGMGTGVGGLVVCCPRCSCSFPLSKADVYSGWAKKSSNELSLSQESPSQLRHWLGKLDLNQYADQLEAVGYTFDIVSRKGFEKKDLQYLHIPPVAQNVLLEGARVLMHGDTNLIDLSDSPAPAYSETKLPFGETSPIFSQLQNILNISEKLPATGIPSSHFSASAEFDSLRNLLGLNMLWSLPNMTPEEETRSTAEPQVSCSPTTPSPPTIPQSPSTQTLNKCASSPQILPLLPAQLPPLSLSSPSTLVHKASSGNLEHRRSRESSQKKKLLNFLSLRDSRKQLSNDLSSDLTHTESSKQTDQEENIPECYPSLPDSISSLAHYFEETESENSAFFSLTTQTTASSTSPPQQLPHSALAKVLKTFICSKPVQGLGNLDETDIAFALLNFYFPNSSSDLLDLMCICFYPTKPDDIPWPKFRNSTLVPIRKRCLCLLKTWLELNPSDFENNKALAHKASEVVRLFAQSFTQASALIDVIEKAESGNLTKEITLCGETPTSIIPKEPHPTFEDLNAEELARQLALHHFNLWKDVQLGELLAKSDLSVRIAYMNMSYKKESHWISRTLLSSAEGKKRTAILKTFIHIAEYSKEFNDFQAVFCIVKTLLINSLQQSLARNWESLSDKSRKRFSALHVLILKREEYQLALQRTHKSTFPIPCVPFIDYCSKDIAETCSLEPDEIITFNKLRFVALFLQNFLKLQVTGYNFHAVPAIQEYLRTNVFEINIDEEGSASEHEQTQTKPPKKRDRRKHHS